jgi:hypothetical protein
MSEATLIDLIGQFEIVFIALKRSLPGRVNGRRISDWIADASAVVGCFTISGAVFQIVVVGGGEFIKPVASHQKRNQSERHPIGDRNSNHTNLVCKNSIKLLSLRQDQK